MISASTGWRSRRHHVRIGAAHRAEEELVAHRAAVDDEMDVGRGAAVIGRQPDEAGRARSPRARRDRRRRCRRSRAPSTRASAARETELAVGLGRIRRWRSGGRRRARSGPAGARSARRCTTSATACASARSRLQEFEPRRRRGEEVGDLDPRARRRRRRAHRRPCTPASTTIAAPLGASAGAGRDRQAAPRRRSTAGPRRGSRASRCATRSPSGSFEVAWRSTASSRGTRRDRGGAVPRDGRGNARRGGGARAEDGAR